MGLSTDRHAYCAHVWQSSDYQLITYGNHQLSHSRSSHAQQKLLASRHVHARKARVEVNELLGWLGTRCLPVLARASHRLRERMPERGGELIDRHVARLGGRHRLLLQEARQARPVTQADARGGAKIQHRHARRSVGRRLRLALCSLLSELLVRLSGADPHRVLESGHVLAAALCGGRRVIECEHRLVLHDGSRGPLFGLLVTLLDEGEAHLHRLLVAVLEDVRVQLG